MPSARPPPLPGDKVGPYRLGPALGAGGMAVVYRAEGPTGPVAVKILHQGRTSPEEITRFAREYQTLQRLSHPNVVRVYAAGEVDGYPWLAMELVEGLDLGRVIEEWNTAPPPDRHLRVERYFRQITDALAYVHHQGIIHRDLKPGNVLVGRDDIARLTDFGVVKDPETFPTNLTVAGRLVGTVAFMAPEQITGDKVDARADLYALGALLFMMLTGRRPIEADTIAGYLANHLGKPPRPPSELVPDVPRRLERVCLRLLEKDPARRYPDAAAVLAALDAPAGATIPVVGRAEVLSRLRARVEALRLQRRGGVLALVGPEGSGRSRLLLELVAECGLQRVEAIRVPPGEDPRSTILARLGWPGSTATFVDALRAVDGPLLLAVDDVSALDPATVDALGRAAWERIAAEGAPLLIAVTALPEAWETHPLLNGTATGLVAEDLPLAGLDREGLRALLRERGLGGGAAAILARRMQEELDGLPGAALEQLDALIAAGWLVAGADGALRAHCGPDALRSEPLPLPARVREREAAVLDRMTDDERPILEALAVVGGPASPGLLARVLGRREDELAWSIGALERAGALARTSEGLQELLSIPRPRQRQAIYERLDPDRRAALHRACAAALQEIHRRRAGAIAGQVALHLERGGDPAGAYPVLVAAAQRAVRREEPAVARGLVARAQVLRPAAEAALGPAESARLARQLFLALGDAHAAEAHPEAARDAYTQALLHARAAGDRPAIGRALAGAGLAALASGHPAGAEPELEEAVAALEPGDESWPGAAGALAGLCFEAGDLDRAERLWRAVAEVGAGSRRADAEVTGRIGLASLELARGRGGEAIEELEHAIEVGRGGGAPAAFVDALRTRAELALWAGEWSDAVRIADEMEAVGEADGVPLAGVWSGGIRAAALAGLDELDTAVRAARVAVGLAEVLRAEALAWRWPIRVLVQAGEPLPAAASVLRAPSPPQPPLRTTTARAALAALLATGADERRRLVAAALALPPSVVPGVAVADALDLARAARRAGDVDACAEALRRARSRFDPRLHRGLARGLDSLARST